MLDRTNEVRSSSNPKPCLLIASLDLAPGHYCRRGGGGVVSLRPSSSTVSNHRPQPIRSEGRFLEEGASTAGRLLCELTLTRTRAFFSFCCNPRFVLLGMAAGRRDAEGIALLSVVYGDLDSDDDLEDAAASPPPLTTAIPGDGEAAGSSIVDYAHDEAAASPEHEERETVGDGDDMQVDNGTTFYLHYNHALALHRSDM
jgi:hypothetical protein